MVIMSEWVCGNGKRQRMGEEISDAFSVTFSLGLATAVGSFSKCLWSLTTHVTQAHSEVYI